MAKTTRKDQGEREMEENPPLPPIAKLMVTHGNSLTAKQCNKGWKRGIHITITTTAWQQTFTNYPTQRKMKWGLGVVRGRVRGMDGEGNRCSGEMGEMCSGDGGVGTKKWVRGKGG